MYALGAHGVCIAAAGAGVAALVSSALTGSISTAFVTLAFLIVFGSYRLDYLAEPETREIAAFGRRRRLNAAVTVLAMVVAFLVLLRSAWPAALGALFFPAATLLYTRPILPGRVPAIKDVPLLKAVYTSLCWGGLAFFGLLYFGSRALDVGAWLFLFTFLRMFVNAVACDFKDVEADTRRGTLTLPIWLGTRRTLILLHAVNLGAAALVAFGVAAEILPRPFLYLCGSVVWPAFYLVQLTRRGVDLRILSATVIDAEFLLWMPLVCLAL